MLKSQILFHFNRKQSFSCFDLKGAQIGNMVGLSLGGLLCEHGFGGGWPSIFYTFDAIGLALCALWMT
jgi:hypothetical protein